VGVVTAARFLQVENQVLTLLEAQVFDQIPLVKNKPVSEKKE